MLNLKKPSSLAMEAYCSGKMGLPVPGFATESSTESSAAPPTAAFMSLCHPARACNTTPIRLRCAADHVMQKR